MKRKKKPKTRSGWRLADCPILAPPAALWRPEWRERATALLKAYNAGLLANPVRLSAAQKGRRGAYLASSQGALEALYAVYVWARGQHVEPSAWVRWNGRRTRSADKPLARLLQLFDVERVKAYLADEMTSVNEERARDEEMHARLGASGFVEGRDLFPGAEEAKRNFVMRGREMLCLEAFDLTMGFHPASPVCASCVLRDVCRPATEQRRKRST